MRAPGKGEFAGEGGEVSRERWAAGALCCCPRPGSCPAEPFRFTSVVAACPCSGISFRKGACSVSTPQVPG